MRVAPAISVAIHVAIIAWLFLEPARLLDASNILPMNVDLVPQDEAPPIPPDSAPEPNTTVESAKPAETAQPQTPPPAPEMPKTETRNEVDSETKNGVAAQPTAPATPAAPTAPAAPATPAAPTEVASAPPSEAVEPPLPSSKIDAPPSNTSAKLTLEEVKAFKAQLQRCWNPPASLTDPRLRVVLRTSLSNKGMLVGQPALIAAPASAQGPALVSSAMKALQQCAPYSALPAGKYREWRVLDIAFTARGVIG